MPNSILVADDSRPMRSAIKRTLKAAGYNDSEILEASNGKEALKLMAGEGIDLIITDYNMPEMNGLEFIKRVKSEDKSKHIAVVVISAEDKNQKIKEFMDAGAAGYMSKPFTAEALRNLIANILGEIDYEEHLDDSDDDFDF